jgi:glucokinase
VSTKRILCADIGGTNSRFGHFEADPAENLSVVETKWFKTEEAASFGHLIRLLRESEFQLKPGDADIVVIAVAGPVERGVYSAPPLIPWDVDITNARTDYGFRKALLINDFVAQAYATRSIVGQSAREILPGQIIPGGTVAVIGAGTGLGKAMLVSGSDGRYIAIPSEGAHASFPFVSLQESRFQEFLIHELGEEYITANSVVSGKGLTLIHQFLTGEKLEPKDVMGRCTLNCETLVWASRFYGRACRNFALESLSLGGVYITGGIAAKLPQLVTHDAFSREFRSSKTMGRILAQISVALMPDEESGLWGAAFLGQQVVQE